MIIGLAEIIKLNKREKKQMMNLAVLKLAEIVESPVALRSVNEESEQFLEMLESVKLKGVLESITVRPLKDGETAGKYCIINGLHRYTCAKRAGLTEIPANILDIGDAEALEDQIITNIQKIETKPAEYAKQLKRILALHPLMTMAELAGKICQSTAWISTRFSLLSLSKEIQESVDKGHIGLTNAFALSKLPTSEVPNFLERAMSLTPGEFIPLIDQRKKEIQEAKKVGGAIPAEKFVAVPVMRKPSEIKAEFESPSTAGKVIALAGATSLEAAFAAAISWVLRMDADSVAEAQAKHEARERAKKEASERKSVETLAKKALSAKEKADKLIAEAEAAGAVAVAAGAVAKDDTTVV